MVWVMPARTLPPIGRSSRAASLPLAGCRCKVGDRTAFDMLARAYEKRVYNLAYRLSGSYDEANDISVDAFLRVFQAIRLFELAEAYAQPRKGVNVQEGVRDDHRVVAEVGRQEEGASRSQEG